MGDQPPVLVQVVCCPACAQGKPCEAPKRNMLADLALAVVAGVLVRMVYERIVRKA
jgi:hypothetical protein